MEKISDSTVGAMNGIKDQLNSVTGMVEEHGEVLGEVVEELGEVVEEQRTARKARTSLFKEQGTAKKERKNLFVRMDNVEDELQRRRGK